MDHIVDCPHCSQPSRYRSDNPYRPFCSQRCQQLDLGAWASEEHRMPQTTLPDPAQDDPPS